MRESDRVTGSAKSVLLVYRSRTGFTERYAGWIAESIPCKVVPLERIKTVNIDDYDIVVYGAGIRAGLIQGLKECKRLFLSDEAINLVVFASGGAPDEEAITAEVRANNFSAEELDQLGFFYFQSGLNYEKMGVAGRSLMGIYRTILETKKDKSDVEDGTSRSLSGSYDVSNREQVQPLIDYVNELRGAS